MAAIFGGGGGGQGGGRIGDVGQFPLEQWFFEMPPCTRYWTSAAVLTAILAQCKVVNPLQLYYSFRAVYVKSQVRVISLPLCSPPCAPKKKNRKL